MTASIKAFPAIKFCLALGFMMLLATAGCQGAPPGKPPLATGEAPHGSIVRAADPECNSSQDFLAANCSELRAPELLTRPEWAGLFPEAKFYLVRVRVIQNPETNMYGYYQNNYVVAEQGGRSYKAENFDQLLRVYGLMVSDDNRERVAQALALMTAANYLDGAIEFSPLEAVQYSRQEARHAYNYALTAQAEKIGAKIGWFFVFDENGLRTITGPQLVKGPGEVTAETGPFLPRGLKEYLYQP